MLMRKGWWAMGVAAGLLIRASQAFPQQGQLPPLVYICPMPADAAVVDDKPGKCPVCGMTLVATRLDAKWWCPTHQTVVVRDGPGRCPLDGKALVQVTLAEHWTCPDAPESKFTAPRTCASGQPSKIVYEARAHGDHNPRHDGQFFMASDAWHHLEGTYPKAGLFRAYFYDNFTKPISAAQFSGSLIVLDKKDRELGSVPLTPAAGGTLEAAIPASLAALPLKAAAKVRFASAIPEQRFDFFFSALSNDPAPPAATSTRTRPRPASPAAVKATPARTGTAVPRNRSTTVPPPPAATASPTAAAPVVLDSPLNIPPALADALDESRLPNDTAGLLTELSSRAREVESLISAGNLAQIWLPATATKTVALVLNRRAESLAAPVRSRIDSAIRRIVVASWALDNYGDLGNRKKISDAYADLAAAVSELKAAYAAS